MADKTGKKVLIVGSGAKEYSLARKFLSYENVEAVVVAPGNPHIKGLCECVDIREDKPQELLEYVLEHGVDLTIATSDLAIKSDIADIFHANGQMIFAPTVQGANFALNKSSGKKLMYKLKIPTPKFGIFEKQQLVYDYLKTSEYPVVIRTDEDQKQDRLACPTQTLAKLFTDDLYLKDEKKVIVEDYVFGHDFSFYVITDGYHAIPIASVANYKFASEGDGGLLTKGVGAFVPDYKISKETEDSIIKDVVEVLIKSLDNRGNPYLGILGIDGVLKDDGSYVILEFKTFMQDHDCEAVLSLIEENLYTLFEACVIGSFADDYHSIKISDNSAVSCMIFSTSDKKDIENVEMADNYIPMDCSIGEDGKLKTAKGKNIIVTGCAKTLTRARDNMYEDIDLIEFCGKKYRRDICLKQ